MNKTVAILAALLMGSLVVFGLSLLLSYPVMWLANYLFAPSLLVTIFGASSLSLSKAFWLNWFLGLTLRTFGPHKIPVNGRRTQ